MPRAKDALEALVAPAHAVFLDAKIESELIDLDPEDAAELLASTGQDESGLDQLARIGFDTLGLQTYLTAGPKEARAWTIGKGWKAPQAAGVIHTDFEKGFIKAEVISFDDLDRRRLGARGPSPRQGPARGQGLRHAGRRRRRVPLQRLTRVPAAAARATPALPTPKGPFDDRHPDLRAGRPRHPVRGGGRGPRLAGAVLRGRARTQTVCASSRTTSSRKPASTSCGSALLRHPRASTSASKDAVDVLRHSASSTPGSAGTAPAERSRARSPPSHTRSRERPAAARRRGRGASRFPR